MMEQTTLAQALLAFHGEFQGLHPDSANPYFKNMYISLDGILSTVRPMLFKHGIFLTQDVCGDGVSVGVKTTLTHSSGEVMTTDVLRMTPAKPNDPQSAGSCITYSKRYQLAALLGVCDMADDDGNAGSDTAKKVASTPPTKPVGSNIPPNPPIPPIPPPQSTSKLPDGFVHADEQAEWVGLIKAAAKAAKLDKAGREAVMVEAIGKVIPPENMSMEQAKLVYNAIRSKGPIPFGDIDLDGDMPDPRTVFPERSGGAV